MLTSGGLTKKTDFNSALIYNKVAKRFANKLKILQFNQKQTEQDGLNGLLGTTRPYWQRDFQRAAEEKVSGAEV